MVALLRGIALGVVLLLGDLAVCPAATFTWSSPSDALTLDPQGANDVVSVAVQSAAYEPLIGVSPTLQLEPVLATSWERVADDRWRIKLRPSVRFHDGQPFTADDVVFTVTRGLSERADTRQELTSIKSAIKVDDLTVDILTKGPDPILPRELTFLRMMSRSWAEEHNANLPPDIKTREENFASRHVNGTGPYRLVSREPDMETAFEPNPGWWGAEKPALDKVTFRPIANDATRVAALLSGVIDMMEPVPVQDLDRVRQSSTLKLMQGPELRTVYLGFDQFRPELLDSNVKGRNPFKDVRVRKAFYQAIDMGAIETRILRGAGRPIGMMIAAQVDGYSADLDKRLPFDPAAAKQLLADAGYPDGFEVGMDCPNNRYLADESVCQAVAAMLARVGIKVALATKPKSLYFPKLFQRNVSFWMFGWTPPTYDALHLLINGLATTDKAANRGAFNHGGYSNPEVDRLILAAQGELDSKSRLRDMQEAFRLHAADVGHIPLYQQSLLWGMKQRVDMIQLPDGVVQVKWVRVN
jgi:peptide/nickel transport system substrate-binding protein